MDPEFTANEEKYTEIKKEILDKSDDDDSDGSSGSGSDSSSDSDGKFHSDGRLLVRHHNTPLKLVWLFLTGKCNPTVYLYFA